jgi:hypothetical protein
MQKEKISNLYDPEKRNVTIIASIIGVFLFIALNIVVYRFGISSGQKQSASEKKLAAILTPTPTPLPLICKGTYEFSVTSKGSGGFVQKGLLSPCDPKHGAEQKLQIMLNGNVVTDLQAELKTDGKKRSIPLKKLSSQNNTWECSWVMDDSYDYTYALVIKGMSGGKEVALPMMFR